MSAPLAVVFDMDGLMFNSEDVYTKVGAELMRRRGCEYTRELNEAVMGRPPRACFEIMIQWHSLDATWETLAAESEETYISLLDGNLSTMPGLLELLDALEKAGIPKAICTSSCSRLVQETLSRFQLASRFAFILTCEDITKGKPDPEIYLKAAARFGIDPTQMLVLEDSRTGCLAASASGAFTVAVPGEHSKHQDFSIASLVVQGLDDPQLYQAAGLADERNARGC